MNKPLTPPNIHTLFNCTLSRRLNNLIKKLKHLHFRYKMYKASPSGRAELMREKFYHLGKDVELYTNSFGTEPYLISIHDNVCVAANVKFINHDLSVFRVAYSLGLEIGSVDKVGSIELHNNCFVGAHSILMPNCSVGKNSVVAAGSIVTKHIPDNEVWGGIPAKYIMDIDTYRKKMIAKSEEYPWMPLEKKNEMTEQELIVARQKYFFNSNKS